MVQGGSGVRGTSGSRAMCCSTNLHKVNQHKAVHKLVVLIPVLSCVVGRRKWVIGDRDMTCLGARHSGEVVSCALVVHLLPQSFVGSSGQPLLTGREGKR